MPSTLTFEDVQSICLAPFLQRERTAEAIRHAEHQQEVARARGVSWSGLAPTTPVIRSEEEIRRDAQAARDRAVAFAASPRGRFVAALSDLESDGFIAEAATARAAYARGFADTTAAACPVEITCALAPLARLAAPQARRACLALADLLSATLRFAAE